MTTLAASNRSQRKKVSVSAWLGLKSEAHDRRVERIPENAKIAPFEIDDPNALIQTERIVVIRSISNDPLAWMHAHNQIDDAKYFAGRKWQSLYERSVLGAIQAVDTSKEPVDGGRWPEMLTDGQAMASRELARLATALGPEMAILIREVLGHGMFIAQVAQSRGLESDWAKRGLSREFKRGLDVLAVEMGLATRKETRVVLAKPTPV